MANYIVEYRFGRGIHRQAQRHRAVAAVHRAEAQRQRVALLHIRQREAIIGIVAALANYIVEYRFGRGICCQCQRYGAVAIMYACQAHGMPTGLAQQRVAVAVGQHVVADSHGIGMLIGGVYRQGQYVRAVAAVRGRIHKGIYPCCRQQTVAITIGQHVIAHGCGAAALVRGFHRHGQQHCAVATIHGREAYRMDTCRGQQAVAVAVGQHVVAHRQGGCLLIGGIHRQGQANHAVAAVHRGEIDAVYAGSVEQAVAVAVGQHVVADSQCIGLLIRGIHRQGHHHRAVAAVHRGEADAVQACRGQRAVAIAVG